MRTVKAVIGVLLVVGLFYTAFKLLPPYFNNYQLQDVLDSEALTSSYAYTQTDDMLRDKIVKKAKNDCDVILRPEEVKITHDGNITVIAVQYSVTVDLPGYQVELKFSPSSSNKRI